MPGHENRQSLEAENAERIRQKIKPLAGQVKQLDENMNNLVQNWWIGRNAEQV